MSPSARTAGPVLYQRNNNEAAQRLFVSNQDARARMLEHFLNKP
jgi:hypothetical protein